MRALHLSQNSNTDGTPVHGPLEKPRRRSTGVVTLTPSEHPSGGGVSSSVFANSDTVASKLNVVVLAAGLGKRMHSALPKVLHPLAGRPIVSHVLAAASTLSPRSPSSASARSPRNS